MYVIDARLGKDAEVSMTGSGKLMLKFSAAETVGWGDNKKTRWWNCTIFQKGDSEAAADWMNFAARCLKKGAPVSFDGRLAASPHAWVGRDGKARAGYDVVVDNIQLPVHLADEGTTPAAAAPEGQDEIPF